VAAPDGFLLFGAWTPGDPYYGVEQPDIRLARIAGGAFDGYIASWADGLTAVGATVHVPPMHEINKT
jgi:hypothetical protein